jgi:RNA polymerase sigma factor (sigma-70 family)
VLTDEECQTIWRKEHRLEMTRDGYGQAYQRGFDLTVRFLLSRGVCPHEAHEVAQVGWEKGWERLGQLRNENLVITWVNTIALNAYRSWIRRKPKIQALLEQRHKTAGINLAAIDVTRLLGFCRPANRHLLEQYMTGASMAELAKEQGVSETAVRIRLLRARRDLRLQVEKKTAEAQRPSDIFALAAVGAA